MGCPVASDCIALELDDRGSLIPTWIFAPAPNNISCGPAGLISPRLLSPIGCAQVPDETIIPNFGGYTSQFGPTVTLTNPSATRDMVVSFAVLFGTAQIAVHNLASIFVQDFVGLAATGGLVAGSYTPVNTAEVENHPEHTGGTEYAFNCTSASQWTCPTPIGPSQGVDVSFERRVSMGGTLGGYGQAILRATFIYLWGVVV